MEKTNKPVIELKSVISVAPILLLGIVLLALMLFLFLRQRQPRITRIDTISATFGDTVIIEGSNFGLSNAESKLIVGSREIVANSIVESIKEDSIWLKSHKQPDNRRKRAEGTKIFRTI